jgi:hypothetical protein
MRCSRESRDERRAGLLISIKKSAGRELQARAVTAHCFRAGWVLKERSALLFLRDRGDDLAQQRVERELAVVKGTRSGVVDAQPRTFGIDVQPQLIVSPTGAFGSRGYISSITSPSFEMIVKGSSCATRWPSASAWFGRWCAFPDRRHTLSIGTPRFAASFMRAWVATEKARPSSVRTIRRARSSDLSWRMFATFLVASKGVCAPSAHEPQLRVDEVRRLDRHVADPAGHEAAQRLHLVLRDERREATTCTPPA